MHSSLGLHLPSWERDRHLGRDEHTIGALVCLMLVRGVLMQRILLCATGCTKDVHICKSAYLEGRKHVSLVCCKAIVIFASNFKGAIVESKISMSRCWMNLSKHSIHGEINTACVQKRWARSKPQSASCCSKDALDAPTQVGSHRSYTLILWLD